MKCPLDKCERYSKPRDGERACYYEPQCWKGYWDTMVLIVKLKVGR